MFERYILDPIEETIEEIPLAPLTSNVANNKASRKLATLVIIDQDLEGI